MSLREYWAILSNSEVKKYPNKGYREILTFLILNDDKQTPKLNNKEEAIIQRLSAIKAWDPIQRVKSVK